MVRSLLVLDQGTEVHGRAVMNLYKYRGKMESGISSNREGGRGSTQHGGSLHARPNVAQTSILKFAQESGCLEPSRNKYGWGGGGRE